jgi:hypothetical protein
VTITDQSVAASSVAVNTDVTPAAPSGLLAGDLVLIFAAIRNSGAGAPVAPAGWSIIEAIDNIAVFGRQWQNADVMPAVTFTGGVAGADTYARAMKVRGASPGMLDGTTSTLSNSSAQNIAYPALDVPRDDCLLVMALWKQDDATSLGTPPGWTANGHTNMTTGDDMLCGWFSQIQTTEADIAASTVTVTGGATAVSRAIMLAVPPAPVVSVVPQDTYPPRVLVSVTGLDGEVIFVYRVVAGVRTEIRGGFGVAADPAFLALDAELPFGVPVHYVVTVNGTEYSTVSATYDLPDGPQQSKPAFSDAITGQAAEAIIMSWPDKDYGRDSAVLRLASGANAVVQGPVGQFTSTLTLVTETLSSRNNLETLLHNATGGTIQVRQGGAYSGVDCYLNVLSFKLSRFSQDGTDERRIFVMEVAEVERWAYGLLTRGYTYADLDALYPAGTTYADLAADYATYLDLAVADLS